MILSSPSFCLWASQFPNLQISHNSRIHGHISLKTSWRRVPQRIVHNGREVEVIKKKEMVAIKANTNTNGLFTDSISYNLTTSQWRSYDHSVLPMGKLRFRVSSALVRFHTVQSDSETSVLSESQIHHEREGEKANPKRCPYMLPPNLYLMRAAIKSLLLFITPSWAHCNHFLDIAKNMIA